MSERVGVSNPYPLQSQTSTQTALTSALQTQPSQQVLQQQSMMSPVIDINAVNVCRVGQEMVHDIVGKAQEVFQLLTAKSMQLNMSAQQYQDRKSRLEENLNHINSQFRKLRLFHDKVVEISSHSDEPTRQEIIPVVGAEIEPSLPGTEAYRLAVEQHKEIVEQVRLKNQQLKEIIDQIRTIIWEINTMITMRKT